MHGLHELMRYVAIKINFALFESTFLGQDRS